MAKNIYGPLYVRARMATSSRIVSRAELMLAIRTIPAGQRYLCKAVASKVLSGFLSPTDPKSAQTPASPITDREREVLTRVAQGNSNKAIARELGISPKTVAKHRSNLMYKLQLHNIAGVTMYAIQNGLAGSDSPKLHAAIPVAELA